MFNKKNNFVVHHEHERTGLSRKTWIIIACVAGVIVLAVALILLIPRIGNNAGDNTQNEGDQNTPTQNAEPPVLGIYVSATPDKTVYYVGDTPNYAGLKIGVEQFGADGYILSYDEAYNELTVTGFDSSAPVKEQTITVKYKDFTTTFTVEIKEIVQQTHLVGIRVDPLPNKLTYKLGQALSYTGGRLVCEYSDGTTKTLYLDDPGVSVSGFGAIYAPGEYDITVEYFDDKGGYASTTFKITMTE